MQRRRLLILSLIFLGLGTVSCGWDLPAESVKSRSWWFDWLNQPACEQPCWEGITPGVTTVAEASAIVENNLGASITFQAKQGFDWRFSETGTDGGHLYAKEGDIVSAVIVSSSDYELHVDEVVAVYGEPGYVEAYDCRAGMCETVLVFPELGMLLDVFVRNNREAEAPQVGIQPGTAVQKVVFFPAGLKNFKEKPEYQGYPLWEWKGYGDYP